MIHFYHNRAYVELHRLLRHPPDPASERAEKNSSAYQGLHAPTTSRSSRSTDDLDKILNDKDVEMLVIALPLWLHAPVAIKAMEAGKHVFCEKLMAHNIGQCKQMVRTSHDKNKLLAIGHQRHYSALYDNANYLVQNGQLGEIRHIRALWHRNNARPVIAKDKDGKPRYDDEKGDPVYVRDEKGNVLYQDSWKPPIPDKDKSIDFAKYGYKSLDELVRWRLYDRTGAGLMAELGSHQLDACSIFLGKKHPLAVTGIGGTFFYTDGREARRPRLRHLRVPRQGPKNDPRDRHLLLDQHQRLRALRRGGPRHERHDVRRGGARYPPVQRRPGPLTRRFSRRRRASQSRRRVRRRKPVLEASPSLRRPDDRASSASAAASPWPTPRATVSRGGWSTSPIASATATLRNTMKTKSTSRAAAAKWPWPTPSSP